eukprot:COSAG01_NODE_23_length_37704_cov_30.005877_11_plen_79_part_00
MRCVHGASMLIGCARAAPIAGAPEHLLSSIGSVAVTEIHLHFAPIAAASNRQDQHRAVAEIHLRFPLVLSVINPQPGP